MKTTLLGLIAIIILGTSCKKTYNYYQTPYQAVQAITGENYNVDDSYIKSKQWTIVSNYATETGSVLIWKLNVKGTNNFLIIDKAPPEKFWAIGYQVGDTIDGQYVILLNIKR